MKLFQLYSFWKYRETSHSEDKTFFVDTFENGTRQGIMKRYDERVFLTA